MSNKEKRKTTIEIIEKDDMKFDIKFDKDGENIGITLNYRGLPQKSREEILNFIDEQFE